MNQHTQAPDGAAVGGDSRDNLSASPSVGRGKLSRSIFYEKCC